MEPDIEKWIRELDEAGWKRYSRDIWMSPWGKLYRGPYLAWTVMRRVSKW
jgi:hypothetical protein